jgi:glycosyltransferase involved in cell wall biosynthesis
VDHLRVCLDARLVAGTYGGIQHVIVGLASGLSHLTDGDEEYLFMTYAGADEWLRPFIQGPCKILPGPNPPRQQSAWKPMLKSALPVVYRAWRKLTSTKEEQNVPLPKSDGIIEKAQVDLVHFTNQQGFITDVPSIYHPHDLQHLHLPQFFRPHDRAIREVQYRAFCGQSRMVAVTSSWTRRDVIEQYQLSEDKVKVVPWAPPISAYPNPSPDDLAAVRNKFMLPPDFIYYPAQTFAHKNHIGLLDSLSILRDRHALPISLVSSGKVTEYFPNIQERINALRLNDQVKFLGFVGPLELQCLYRLCTCVVIPTKFEAASFPLWEAYASGAPTACSNVTSLPDQAGDAALIFHPDRPEEIVDAILRLWTDESLRRVLIERGKRNVARFTWEKTVKMFRAHYRRIAGRRLTEEDCALLDAPPIL